jgi:hypothetical protein
MEDKKKGWTYIALGGLALSVITLFLPIIQYTSAHSVFYSYNIIGFFTEFYQFVDDVLYEFDSEAFYWVGVSTGAAIVLLMATIGVCAIVLAFGGVISMSKQYESVWPFRLSVMGIIGTAIPALAILTVYLLSYQHFLGVMRIGAYVIVTPLAMIAACIAVTYRHHLTKEQLAIQEEAQKYIYPAGDLS